VISPAATLGPLRAPQVSFQRHMSDCAQQLGGAALVGTHLWVLTTQGAAAADASSGTWCDAEVTAYDEDTAQHEVRGWVGGCLEGRGGRKGEGVNRGSAYDVQVVPQWH
jgi:hypothetical protein